MTEEQRTEEQRPSSEVQEELEALGRQLSTAVKALWESEDSRKLRQEIGEGFVELGRQIDAAAKSAHESEAAKEFSAQIKETMDKARQADISENLERGLLSGLRALNQEISKLVKSLEEKETAGTETEEA
jgi:hypothetical protein